MLEDLFDNPCAYQFFQAVRLLERQDRHHAPVGLESDPGDEVVRFKSRVSFGFPCTDLDAITPRRDQSTPPELTVGMLGIANPASFGSLPHPYVELIQTLGRQKNTALQAFLDALNHRLISLFYRAWKKHHFAIAYERDRSDLFEDMLFSVIGLGTSALRDRLGFDDRALLFRAGMVGAGQATAQGLGAMLQDYLGVPVRVEEFVPVWYTITRDDQYRLGVTDAPLGQGVVLGSRICTGEFQFRVRLGPVDWDTYQAFLPEGASHAKLIDLIRFAVGPLLDFEIQLVLAGDQVPPVRVSGEAEGCQRLGWSTWLIAETDEALPETNPEVQRNRDEGVFSVRELTPSA